MLSFIQKIQFNIIGISFKQGFGYLKEYVFVPSIHESSMNFTLIILNLRLIEQLSCVTLRTNNQFSTTNGVILSSLVLKTDISRQGLYLTQLFNLIHFFRKIRPQHMFASMFECGTRSKDKICCLFGI